MFKLFAQMLHPLAVRLHFLLLYIIKMKHSFAFHILTEYLSV